MQDNDIFLLRQMICPSFFQISTFLRMRYRFIILFPCFLLKYNKKFTTIIYTNFFLKKYQDQQYKKRAIEIFYDYKNGLQKQLDFYSKKKVSLWTYRKFLLSEEYQDAHTRQKGAEKHRNFLQFSGKTVSLKIRTRPKA